MGRERRGEITRYHGRQQCFEVYGDVSLNSLRRFLTARDIPAEIESEAHTVAGWVLGLFGSIPKNGDITQTDDFIVTVLGRGCAFA